MTQKAIEALAADREALLKIGAGLGETEWGSESGCPGWSVQSVVAHLGALYWMVVDPSTLPDVSDLPTERAQDFFVEQRRSWTAAEVLADYESVSTRALAALEGLADQDFSVPLGDLGTYPASVLPSAFVFDHFLHIRSDLFAPRGPLTGAPPPSDELHLGPALDWVEAALPQQNASALAALGAAVEIDLSGPGARLIRFGPGEPASRVRSDTPSFVRWVTQRTTWDAARVACSGDEGDLAIARSLRVF
ncbi:MAG: maleylpyruvate isomerase family mycothiol-dependent enzyme [Acidimicrobiales bacterium]